MDGPRGEGVQRLWNSLHELTHQAGSGRFYCDAILHREPCPRGRGFRGGLSTHPPRIRNSRYSQLYLTAAKNTSLLTVINILVYEASHGLDFLLSAKNAFPCQSAEDGSCFLRGASPVARISRQSKAEELTPSKRKILNRGTGFGERKRVKLTAPSETKWAYRQKLEKNNA
jgi:hypothetical protein